MNTDFSIVCNPDESPALKFFHENKNILFSLAGRSASKFDVSIDEVLSDLIEYLVSLPGDYFRDNTNSFIIQSAHYRMRVAHRSAHMYGRVEYYESIEEKVGDDTDNESATIFSLVGDSLGAIMTEDENVDLRIDLYALVAELSERDRYIVGQLMNEVPCQEIAKNLGIAGSGITKRKKVIAEKLSALIFD